MPSQGKAAGPYRYRRDLPHIQKFGRLLFVTFGTHGRWILPPEARTLVFNSCLYEHRRRIQLHAFVIMPEHVHMLFNVRSETLQGDEPLLYELLRAIKSASAHAINKRLGRKGHVWQEETFDHVVRHAEGFDAYVGYIRENAVKRGLVISPKDYEWLWVNSEESG